MNQISRYNNDLDNSLLSSCVSRISQTGKGRQPELGNKTYSGKIFVENCMITRKKNGEGWGALGNLECVKSKGTMRNLFTICFMH